MDVVITIHNPPDISLECVRSLLSNQEGVDNIIIIDNASTDLVNVPALESLADVVITLKNRVSIAASWNIGISISQAEYVLVTNDDILFAPGWGPPLIEALSKDPKIAILQPFNTLSNIPRNFPKNYSKENRLGNIPKDNFIGCCFVIRTSILSELKDYDKKQFIDWNCGTYFYEKFYPFGPEDQDFYRRVKNIGYKTMTHFGSYVHHYTGQTMKEIKNFEALKEENNQRFIERWQGK